MQELREAIRRQEYQLKNCVKKGGHKETSLVPKGECTEEFQMMNHLSDDHIENRMERHLRSTGSDTSHISHWSFNIDTINCSIGEVEQFLKMQDKNIVGLISENEGLRSELLKKEKELKKQKFLVKAEREMFEQYKRNILVEIKKNNPEESSTEIVDKPSREMLKLKSELAHYRQMYLEMNHNVSQLTKRLSLLKNDNVELKAKLLKQEECSNRFIFDMAQRFDISRKEMTMVMSKRFESETIPATNLAWRKIADRNARLAYDNSMLKFKLNMLEKKLMEKNDEERKFQSLKNRTSIYRDISKEQVSSSSNLQKCNTLTLKSSLSGMSGLSIDLQRRNTESEVAIRTSVTNLLERNKRYNLSQEGMLNKKIQFSKLNVEQWDCLTERSGLARTESAPELYKSDLKH